MEHKDEENDPMARRNNTTDAKTGLQQATPYGRNLEASYLQTPRSLLSPIPNHMISGGRVT